MTSCGFHSGVAHEGKAAHLGWMECLLKVFVEQMIRVVDLVLILGVDLVIVVVIVWSIIMRMCVICLCFFCRCNGFLDALEITECMW